MKIRHTLANNDYRYLHVLLGIGIILLFYHIRFGLGIINPTYVNWLIDNPELANSFFSFGFYRHEPWTFPLGTISNYFYPVGSNLFMCDLPLFSLLFKPFSPLLPLKFHYLGIWYLLCHVLQAWFTILLCERLGIGGLNKIVTVVFMLFAPLLMSRYIHPTLFCQWMLIAGIWIYLLDPEKTPVTKILLYQGILFVISGMVFAYMWVMVLGFSSALFLRLWLVDRKLTFLRAAFSFGLHGLVMGILWYAIGLFTSVSTSSFQTEGWGVFTLNLNSPFNPMYAATLLPTLPYIEDQVNEGFNYLGAGILLLVVIGILTVTMNRLLSRNFGFKKRQTMSGIVLWPLLLFLVVCTVYSLSNRVSFNTQIVFEYPLSKVFDPITRSFRSSGRFFWPVYYFIFIASIYFFSRLKLKNTLKTTILTGCLVLQLYDIQYFLRPSRYSYSHDYTPPINNAVWEKLIGSFDVVFFYPGFRRKILSFDDYRYFTYYAVLHEKKINMGYMPRFDVLKTYEAMGTESAAITNRGLEETYLYVSSEPYLNRLILPIGKNDAYCYKIDGYLVFFKKTERTRELVAFIEHAAVRDIKNEIESSLTMSPWKDSQYVVTSNAKLGLYETDQSDEHIYMKGWAFSTTGKGPGEDSIRIVLSSDITGRRWISRGVFKMGTQDVADFFGKPELSQVGFGISLLTANLPNGSYHLSLLFSGKENVNTLFPTETIFSINRPALAVPGKLPEKFDGDIRFDVNRIDEDSENVNIVSWAYPVMGACPTCLPYYSLTSDVRQYLVRATPVARPDVRTYFKDSTLTNTGVIAKFTKKTIDNGLYQVGILLKDTLNSKNYFAATGKAFSVTPAEFVEPTNLTAVPTGKDSIVMNLDKLLEVDQYYEIEGWGFIPLTQPGKSNPLVLLESDECKYVLEAQVVNRHDVQDYFKLSYDVSMSGFKLKVKKNKLSPGVYKVCLLLENPETGQKTVSCTGSTIRL